MPRVFYSWGAPSPSPHASTPQSDAGCWPGLPVIPPARPHFVLPTSLWGPARSSSLQPGHLQVASLMRTTWDLRGGGGETWVERETDAGPGGPDGGGAGSMRHRTWGWEGSWEARGEPGGAGARWAALVWSLAAAWTRRQPGRGRGSSRTQSRWDSSPGERRPLLSALVPPGSVTPVEFSSSGTGFPCGRGEIQGQLNVPLASSPPPHLSAVPAIILTANKTFHFHTYKIELRDKEQMFPDPNVSIVKYEGLKWPPTPVFLPGKSPWTEEPDRVQSVRSWESRTGLSDYTAVRDEGETCRVDRG